MDTVTCEGDSESDYFYWDEVEAYHDSWDLNEVEKFIFSSGLGHDICKQTFGKYLKVYENTESLVVLTQEPSEAGLIKSQSISDTHDLEEVLVNEQTLKNQVMEKEDVHYYVAFKEMREILR